MSKLYQTTIICAATVLLLAFSPLGSTNAFAGTKTCVSESVSARGEPSKFKWLARTKTRANWRAKVRAMSDLGDPYANWNRAENAHENCTNDSNGTICEFTGIPCRKGN